jgi:hypothetical protein
MKKVISEDGASIVYDQLGKGPAVILVCGGVARQTSNKEEFTLLTNSFPRLNQIYS